jgi:stage IV sporulation protein FB
MKKPSLRVKSSFLIPMFLLAAGCAGWELALYLSAVLLHEAGHLLTLTLFRVGIRSVDLSLTGASIQMDSDLISYKKEILIALSGPLANLLGCGLSVLLLRSEFCREGMLLFFSNALLCLFNLIPLESLDGGRALYALICQRWEPDKAGSVLGALEKGITPLLLVLGLFLCLCFHNPSPLILLFALRREKSPPPQSVL